MLKGGYSSRRKWETGGADVEFRTDEPKVNRDEKYEEYLIRLQHKNRIIKQLQTKDEKQRDLERKEQGFTLYLNGANQPAEKSTKKDSATRKKRVRKRAKTARANGTDQFAKSPTSNNENQTHQSTRRTKTAPEKRSVRRNWLAGSHDIRTCEGQKIRAKAPGILTGVYEDDFELGTSVNTQATYSQDFSSESSSYDSNSSCDVTASESDVSHVTEGEESDTGSVEEELCVRQSQMSERRGAQRPVRPRAGGDNRGGDGDLTIEARRYKVSKKKREDGLEGQGGEQLMLSIKDVKKLRQSLEMSLARQRRRQSSDSDGGSPIPKVPEDDSSSSSEAEIVEEETDFPDSLPGPTAASHTRKVQFRPKDVIVLEIGGADSGHKSERKLSAARKGDPANFGALREERRATPSSKDRPTSGKKAPPPPPRDTPLAGGGANRKAGTTSTNQTRAAGILANKTPTPVRGKPKDDVFMKPEATAAKKSRPLSASRKSGGCASSTTDALDSTVEARAVMEAMRRENDSIAEKKRQRREKGAAPPSPSPRPTLTPRAVTPRQSHSAPGHTGKSRDEARESQEGERRAVTASQKSNNRESTIGSDQNRKSQGSDPLNLDLKDDVEKIVAKVLKLDPRGQRRLLKALAQIEDIELRGSSVPTHSRTHQTVTSSLSDAKRLAASRQPSEPIEIHIEILSNWGHDNRVGLTEIQLFDLHRRRIDLGERDVMVRNVEHPRGDVMNLFNGKCKTTRERYMMSCKWPTGDKEPVELLLVVPNTHGVRDFGLSSIKIWNYNRSLLDLSMCVRQMRISVDGRCVFDGELEKGCGNQVFDYSNTVCLVETAGESSDSPHTPRKDSSRTNTPLKEYPPPPVKPVSEVVLPLELLHQPSEYDEPPRHTPTPTSAPSLAPQQRNSLSPRKSVSRNYQDGNHSKSRDSQSRESKSRESQSHESVSRESQSRESQSRESKSRESKSQPRDLPPPGRQLSGNERLNGEVGGEEREPGRSRGFTRPQDSDADGPTDSLSTPRQRHRRRKERKDRMAARLDGGASDVDVSTSASVSTSVEQSQDRSPPNGSSLSRDNSVDSRTHSGSASRSHTLPNNTHTSAEPKAAEKPRAVTAVAEETLSVHRPNSGLGGTMSDDECMLEQLQKLTVREQDRNNKQVPSWLKKEQENSRRNQKSKEDNALIQNWPSSRGTDHLKTEFDDTANPMKKASTTSSSKNCASSCSKTMDPNTNSSVSESRKSGTSINSRKSNNVNATDSYQSARQSRGNLSGQNGNTTESTDTDTTKHTANHDPALKIDLGTDDKFDIDKEIEVEMSKMAQIESARAQWRKQEEEKLEASWNALSMFDRKQKTRLSLDLEDDIMDEYLNSERNKPKVPTIPEEDSETGADPQIHTSAPTPSDTSTNTAEDEFVIPELPRGRILELDILTTWGDRHYVGLNGIEIFTSSGEPANVESIKAEPADINILPDYSGDPRVVTNLLDGVNRTRDDTHMWLAPFTRGRHHTVTITLARPATVAMIRLWNYNKSRIHSFRGAKDVRLSLDGVLIFKGEVARACGGIVGDSQAFGDTILFTIDEDILESVADHDAAFDADLIEEADDGVTEEELERPRTADTGQQIDGSIRPFTAATNQPRPQQQQPTAAKRPDADTLVLKGKCLKLNFSVTWGDPHYLGLTGLEVVGRDGQALPLTLNMLHADPRDLHVLPGYERDDRTLDKLIDGENVTMSDEHMWMVPFTEGEAHLLQISFPQVVEMSGLRIWNYNKSAEDTYRGAKFVHITLDGRSVSPPDGILIRKGPGNCYFDYAQEVSFTGPCMPRLPRQPASKPSRDVSWDAASHDYEVVQRPCGFIYQLQLLSTHGDQYYVGLNGIEFYDSSGGLIQLTPNHISAHPHSVNDLPGVENDLRTPDKLIDGHHDTHDGGHMWLAPILPGVLNRIYVIFDEPIEISMMKIWNYSKTPNRGVKDIALLVDDLLVYNGTLEAVTSRGILPHVDGPVTPYTVAFTTEDQAKHVSKNAASRLVAGEQDVQLLNDRKVMAQYGSPNTTHKKPVDQALRPKTSVTRGFSDKRR